MKCQKCGSELTEDTKFCSFCGTEIVTENSNKAAALPNRKKRTVQSENTFNFNKAVSSLKKNINVSDLWENSSILEKIIMVAAGVFLLSFIVSIAEGKYAASLIAFFQSVLASVSFLMKKQIIKVSKALPYIISFALSILLLIPFSAIYQSNLSDAESIDWSDIVLGEFLPEPDSHLGKLTENSKNSLSLDIYKTFPNQFNDYIDDCKEKGFTVDIEQLSELFNAYNSEGYKLLLSYSTSNKCMSVKLNAPLELYELNWPESTLSKILPHTESNIGKLIENSDAKFSLYVGNTSKSEYLNYIKKCEDSGFTINKIEDDNNFSAKNSDGNKLSVQYQGNNVICITVYEPEYDITLDITCAENLLFSKYDVEVYVDDSKQGTLAHGTSDTYKATVKKGTHTVKFVSADKSSLSGEVSIEVSESENFKFEISCSSSDISISKTSRQETENSESGSKIEEKPSETKLEPVSYSTNSKATVKNGNSGVYAYRNRGALYYNYYIIDFDEGYVYFFSDGNGDGTCDKVKIVSGDLNDVLIITYHDGADTWSEGLHFKWKNQPDHLIMQDHNGFEYDFYTTNLNEALSIKRNREIYEF